MERMPARPIWARLLCVALALSLGSGCTTFRPIEERWGGTYDVQPGDKLRIVTRDGRELELVVRSVTSEALVGELTRGPVLERRQATVAFSEIQRIERIAFDGPRTGVLLAGVTLGAVFVWMLFIFGTLMNEARGGAGATPGRAPAR